MITINSAIKEFGYQPEFYLVKHFSYFIRPGAKKVKTEGSNSGMLAFLNPDGSLIIIDWTKEGTPVKTNIMIVDKLLNEKVEPHSFNTFKINGL